MQINIYINLVTYDCADLPQFIKCVI